MTNRLSTRWVPHPLGVHDRRLFIPHQRRGPCDPHTHFNTRLILLWSFQFSVRFGRVALGYGLDDLGFGSRLRLGIFFFTTASRTALGPTQPPIQWVRLSLGVKRPGCKADHSPPSSAEVKLCVELYLDSPNTPSWRGA
jgi:hypothetical protein